MAVLGAGTLVLVAGTGAWAWRRPAVELDRAVEPSRVTKGGDAVVVVRARARGRRAVPPLVLDQQVGPVVVEAVLPRIPAGQVLLRTWALPTARRGEFTVGAMEAVRADPLGLWRRVQRLGAPQPFTVLPRVIPLRPLPTGSSRHLEGPSSDTSPQGSTTFHRLREYVVGDDLRSVHWPSTARAGTLVVRQHVDTAQPYTVVLLDLRPEVHSPGTFEEAVDVAASVVHAATAGRSPVQLRTTAGVRLGGPATRDPGPAMDLLVGVAPDAGGSLQAQLSLLRRDRGGTALVVVTGHPDLDLLRAAAGLRRRFERVVVAAVTAATADLPRYPGVDLAAAADAHGVARVWHQSVVR